MEHRHLNHESFTLAAIDDVIARGRRPDWQALRASMLADQSVAEKIERVCRTKIADPYAQRYHFWKNYVDYRSQTS